MENGLAVTSVDLCNTRLPVNFRYPQLAIDRDRAAVQYVAMGHEETLSFLPKLWWVDVRQCAAAPHGNYVFKVRMTVQLG
jgi:hypothetical protein